MLIWRTVLAAIALACSYGGYYNYMQIHSIAVPAAINLPLGEQNKSELLVYEGYGNNSSEPYIVKLNMTLDDLPKSSWCHGDSWSDTGLELSCVWPTPDAETKFAMTLISIPLPSKDVWAWKFDRQTLQAVPEMRSWFWVNFDNFLMLFFCAVFGIGCVVGFFTIEEEEYRGGSIPVD